MSQVHFVLGIFTESGFFAVHITYVSGNLSLDQPWYGQFVVVVSVLFPIHTLIFNVERYFLSEIMFLNIAIKFIHIYVWLHRLYTFTLISGRICQKNGLQVDSSDGSRHGKYARRKVLLKIKNAKQVFSTSIIYKILFNWYVILINMSIWDYNEFVIFTDKWRPEYGWQLVTLNFLQMTEKWIQNSW